MSSAAPTAAPAPAALETAGADLRQRAGRAILVAPIYVWVCALVLAPNALLLCYSLWHNDLGTITQRWSLENYSRAFGSEAVRVALQRTFVVAVASAALATVIAYPMAYLVVSRLGRWKLVAAMLVLVPLWISLLMRVFSWRIILGEQGVLNGVLTSSGLLDHPSDAFLYSTPTVIMVLTYVAVPYVFLASYVMLDRIPPSLFEASGDCGASPVRTFLHVVWPLSRPGVVSGFSIGFILSFGDYVSPSLVGGLKGTMVGSLVLQQFGVGNDWPYGSAMALVIVTVTVVFLAILSIFNRLEARFD